MLLLVFHTLLLLMHLACTWMLLHLLPICYWLLLVLLLLLCLLILLLMLLSCSRMCWLVHRFVFWYGRLWAQRLITVSMLLLLLKEVADGSQVSMTSRCLILKRINLHYTAVDNDKTFWGSFLQYLSPCV